MKALLTCPDQCNALDTLIRRRPLALLPICGTPLLHLFIRDLVLRGVTDITILASDRPTDVRASVEGGAAWGINVRVIPVSPTADRSDIRKMWRPANSLGWIEPPYDLQVVDHLPDVSSESSIRDGVSYHTACRQFISQVRHHQLGFIEPQPGCVVSRAARISSSARLLAPCWVGHDAVVEAGACIGPGTVIEANSIVGRESEIAESFVESGTYVGSGTILRHTIAAGTSLQNLTTGRCSTINDRVLLADMPSRKGSWPKTSLFARLAAAIILVATSVVVLLALLRARLRKRPLFERLQAVVPPIRGSRLQTTWYRQFTGFEGLWKRWPELWNVVRGEFSWVGNRPLTQPQWESLQTEFDRLWLDAPIGVFSLEDTAEPQHFLDAASRAHAGYYAVFRGFLLDCSILWRILLRV